MNTLQINSKAAQVLSNAASKARNEKPLVRKTATYGVYTVLSSDKTREYKVTCDSATKTITCNCKATKPCYHIAAVAPLHSYIARQKQEAEKASQGQEPEDPFCICGCGRDGFSFFNGTWYCIDCINEMIAAEKTQPPAGLVVHGVITTSMQEIDNLIEQAIEESSEPFYTAAQAAKDKADLFG